MIQAITLTPRTGPIGVQPAHRADPLVLTAPVQGSSYAYRATIYRSQRDPGNGIEALATTAGTVSSGTVYFRFTGLQMSMALLADSGRYDDVWVNLTALQSDGQGVVFKAGWLRVVESGFTASDTPPQTTTFTVVGDTASFEFVSVFYTFQVAEVDEDSGQPDGQEAVVDDNLLFWYAGKQYSTPVVLTSTPPGSEEGEVQVIDDNLLITLSGQTYTCPVSPL